MRRSYSSRASVPRPKPASASGSASVWTVFMVVPKQLIDVERIYLKPAVEGYDRVREILARYPEAGRASRWRRIGRSRACRKRRLGRRLAGIKRGSLVLEVKKSLAFRPNGHSAHFTAPSSLNGYAMTYFLLRAATQGLCQFDLDLRQHRGDPPHARAAWRAAGAGPDRPGALGLRSRPFRCRAIGRRARARAHQFQSSSTGSPGSNGRKRSGGIPFAARTAARSLTGASIASWVS